AFDALLDPAVDFDRAPLAGFTARSRSRTRFRSALTSSAVATPDWSSWFRTSVRIMVLRRLRLRCDHSMRSAAVLETCSLAASRSSMLLAISCARVGVRLPRDPSIVLRTSCILAIERSLGRAVEPQHSLAAGASRWSGREEPGQVVQHERRGEAGGLEFFTRRDPRQDERGIPAHAMCALDVGTDAVADHEWPTAAGSRERRLQDRRVRVAEDLGLDTARDDERRDDGAGAGPRHTLGRRVRGVVVGSEE